MGSVLPSCIETTEKWTHEGVATVPRKIKRLNLDNSRYLEYTAVRQFLFAKDFAERCWHHGRTNLEVNWYIKGTKYLGDNWDMATTGNNVNRMGQACGCIARTSSQANTM